MGKKRKSQMNRQAKKHSAELRRRTAAAERRREAHVRLVVERQGDPRFVQQERTATGRIVTWSRESESGKEIDAALHGQFDAFTAKFGREPGPEDPIFFDPDSDEPVPMRPGSEADAWAEVFRAAEDAGLDPAYIQAWKELGYMVTEMNRHLFTAAEVDAYFGAVHRFSAQQGEDSVDDDYLSDEDLTDDARDEVARGLEFVVGRTLIGEDTDAPALRFVDDLLETLTDGDDAEMVATVNACLMGWLVGARQSEINSTAAIAWVDANLSDEAAAAAERVSGLIGYDSAPDLTVSQVHDELGPLAIAAMIWLAAGVAASSGHGDANWLRQFDPW